MRPLRLFSAILIIPLILWSDGRAQSLESYYRQLSSLMEDHRLSEALELSEDALEEFPEDLRLRVSVAALLLRLNRVHQAAEVLDVALRRGVYDADLLLVVSRVQAGLGDFTAAVSTLQRVLSRDPGRSDLWHYKARFLYLEGNLDRAVEAAGKAMRLSPEETRYRSFYALLLNLADRENEALEEFRMLYRQDPGDARLLLKMADQARLEQRWPQAMEYLELARSADPENPIYPSQLAPVYEKLGLSDEARSAREEAESLEQAFLILRKAIDLRARKLPEEAIELLEDQLEETPSFLTGASFLADLYARTGQTERALELYDRVLGSGGEMGRAAREAGAWIRVQQGNWEDALRVLQSAEGGSRNLELFRGYALAARGDWTGAAERARLLEETYPLSSDLLEQISYFLHRAGDSVAALDYLERAHETAGGDAGMVARARRIRFEHALRLEDERRWEESLKILETLYLEEQKADYLFHIAFVRQKLEQYESAVAAYIRGLSLDPGEDWVRINLAHCLYFLSRFDEAARQWEELTARSDSPEYAYQLGLARIRQWRLEEGWGLVEDAARTGHEGACRLLRAADRSVDGIPECSRSG